jgi:hypothetical protein
VIADARSDSGPSRALRRGSGVGWTSAVGAITAGAGPEWRGASCGAAGLEAEAVASCGAAARRDDALLLVVVVVVVVMALVGKVGEIAGSGGSTAAAACVGNNTTTCGKRHS